MGWNVGEEREDQTREGGRETRLSKYLERPTSKLINKDGCRQSPAPGPKSFLVGQMNSDPSVRSGKVQDRLAVKNYGALLRWFYRLRTADLRPVEGGRRGPWVIRYVTNQYSPPPIRGPFLT